MKNLIIFTFLYSISLLAQDNLLQGLSLTEDISEELKIIVTHLNESPIERELAEEAIAAATLINSDVKKLDKVNLLFLIKSEIYKGLLNNQYMSYSDSVQISSVILKSIREKFKKYDLNYSPMAKWIFQSIEKDLGPYEKDGFIDRYQTVNRSNIKERAKALELSKSLKYISPWIIALESKTPDQFNEMLAKISVDILKQISRKTYFFHEFSSQFATELREGLFVIPSLAPSKPEVKLPTGDASLEERSKEQKEKAEKNLETLENTQDLEGSSKAIDQLIEKEAPPKDQWTPKE
tara:strand:- start:31785 stop:32666 length:882 start_codon:yes stop_codon:yes gene_type:complete